MNHNEEQRTPEEKLGCDHLDAPYRKLLEERDELKEELDKVVKECVVLRDAMKYCAIEPEFLHPINNRQCAVAKNALADTCASIRALEKKLEVAEEMAEALIPTSIIINEVRFKLADSVSKKREKFYFELRDIRNASEALTRWKELQ